MRARVVSRLFDKFNVKSSIRKVLFKQLEDVCLMGQICANRCCKLLLMC